jgi:A/G-specific adenine glycosylase
MNNNHLDKKCRLFSEKLMSWHRDSNRREMPWKGEKDPYRIWLSEIILQQTRVEQGWAYYERFLKKFPDLRTLARASDQAVLKCWEGLGYYSRCRNLIHTARHLAFDRQGVFPSTYDEILQLKGVGPYTAAAIASFAFDLPYAVVDGNVFRVLARYHGIRTPIDKPEGKKIFTSLAQRSLDPTCPGSYNQALMDFGATVCKPHAPACITCPLRRSCVAYREKRVGTLPVKSPAKSKRIRWFYYLLPEWNGKIPVRQRTGRDVWTGLWEPPLLESDKPLRFETLRQKMDQAFPAHWPVTENGFELATHKQVLSHQTIHGCFIQCRLDRRPDWSTDFQWVNGRQISRLPFPKMILTQWKHSPPNR